MVLLNGELRALLSEVELNSILLKGVGTEVREAGRLYETAGRSFTEQKANLDRMAEAIRSAGGVKPASAPNRLSRTPKPEPTPPPAPARSVARGTQALVSAEPPAVVVALATITSSEALVYAMGMAADNAIVTTTSEGLPSGYRRQVAFGGRRQPFSGWESSAS